MMEQPSIGAYGLIGDTRTAALSAEGSIDWLCVPTFDGDPLFGRLVGGEEAGRFSIAPREGRLTHRRYLPGTPVLESTWSTETGTVVLTEAMVSRLSGRLMPQLLLIRHIEARSAPATLNVIFDPRLGPSHRKPRVRHSGSLVVCSWDAMAMGLSSFPQHSIEPGQTHAIELTAGEGLTLVMTMANRAPMVFVSEKRALEALRDEVDWWKKWSAEIDYEGPADGAVRRSLLTLKLLTFAPSGAPVAAPTTSLPESLNSDGNWDYRFSWTRDAATGVEAFIASNKREEAKAFVRWLLHAGRLSRPRLEVMYTLYGRPPPREVELAGWDGYLGNGPVRFGNDASIQTQLDVYGWVLEAAYRLHSPERPITREAWRMVASAADQVSRTWHEPDNGIWEVRGQTRHYTHSKMMAWLALSRALELASDFRHSKKRSERWSDARENLAKTIRREGINQENGVYTRWFGNPELDAGLLIPLPFFEEHSSASLNATIDAIKDELSAGGPLLYRYLPEAEEHREGAFVACSFWLATALARTGRIEEALEVFEATCGFSNDLGLFAEMIEPTTGEALGNFPQALSHAALVQAAQEIRRVSGSKEDAE